MPTTKLRAAIGESGKAPGAFDAVRTWDPVAGDDGKPGVTVAQVGNPTLGPERTREIELGVDLSGPGERVALELTAFRARTTGALIGVQGIMKNRGRWFPYQTGTREIRAMPMLHPAYLLRSPIGKRLAWRDLLTIKKALG